MNHTATPAPPTHRRVAVTGLGLVTPLGNDLETTWGNLLRDMEAAAGGSSRFRPAATWTTAEVRGFDPRPYFRVPKALKLTDRKTRMAVAAASMALDDAGLDPGVADFENLGVLVGTGGADLQIEDLAGAIGHDPGARSARDISFFARQVLSELNPLWLLIGLPNMISAHLSIQWQACGPNSTLMTDWIAGAQAIGEAAAWIRGGETEVVIAGGSDSGVSAVDLAGFARRGLLDRGPAPTSDHGFIPAEGAGLLVLEEREHALSRNARIYGEIVSYATCCVPLGDPEGAPLTRTMSRVLEEVQWGWEELGTILCASVPNTPFGQSECLALEQLTRRPVRELPLVEFKTRIGHTLAASGAIELALILKAFSEGVASAPALCNSLGCMGQSATVAVNTDDQNL